MKQLKHHSFGKLAIKSSICLLLCACNLNIAWADGGKLEKINVENVSLTDTSPSMALKLLLSPSPFGEGAAINSFISIPPKMDRTSITLESSSASLKDLLDKIAKSAGFQFREEKYGLLIGDSIPEDKTFDKLKPFDKIVLEHIEFEDMPIPEFFKHIQKMIPKKKDGKPQVSLKYLGAKKKHAKNDDDNFVEGEGENAFDLGVDALGGGERSLSIVADNMPLGSLISYVCSLANLKYTVGKNTIAVKKMEK